VRPGQTVLGEMHPENIGDMSTPAQQGWLADPSSEKAAILEQLDRILGHEAFKISPRSARLLRYVVEFALDEGNAGKLLKERTVGAELFGLDPAYDTNQNAVVRSAATDVRKRIAAYYHEPGHENEILIELPTGAYLPHFYPASRGPRDKTAPFVLPQTTVEELPAGTELPHPTPSAKQQRRPRGLLILLGAAVIAIAVLALLVWKARGTPDNKVVSRVANMSVQQSFWQPVLEDSAPEPVILICMGKLPPEAGADLQAVPVGDAIAAVDFARVLSSKGARFRVAVADAVSLTELQAATVLMVGGSDNPWTSYATAGWRFHFATRSNARGGATQWIEDGKNPAQKDWVLPNPSSLSGSVEDYAIVARAIDPRSGRWRVIAAGLDGTATAVAARFLVDPNYLKELTGQLPAHWESKNIEAVISVPVESGSARFPQVAAYEIW